MATVDQFVPDELQKRQVPKVWIELNFPAFQSFNAPPSILDLPLNLVQPWEDLPRKGPATFNIAGESSQRPIPCRNNVRNTGLNT